MNVEHFLFFIILVRLFRMPVNGIMLFYGVACIYTLFDDMFLDLFSLFDVSLIVTYPFLFELLDNLFGLNTILINIANTVIIIYILFAFLFCIIFDNFDIY